jgi:HD superfamily phosphohydrolase YqeK
VCAGRDFPGVEALRAKAYRSIPAALLESFEFALDDLVRGDKPILLHTVAAYNQYLLDPAAREDDAPDAAKQEETK